jgi:serine/threonine-protein kinase
MSRWKRRAIIAAVVLGGGLVGGYLLDAVVLPAVVHSRPVVQMPSVVGLPLRQAIAELTAHGFVVQEVRYEPNPTVPEQHVLRQVPYAGSLVRQGRRVYLTVSTGAQQSVVPNVIGLPLRQAQLQLLQQGFRMGELLTEYHDSLPPGTVVWQNPAPSSRALPGTAVTLVVSQQPLPALTMPNVLFQSLEEARALLEQMGLRVVVANTVSDPTFLPNTVVAQSPSEGTPVAPGTTVSLTVTR